MGRGKHWTKHEEMALLQGAGVYGFAWFESHTGASYDWPNAPRGRSRAAIKSKAWRLFQSGITRGSYTLNKICQLTGYDRRQIKRAMQALAQKWKRTSPRGSYLISEEQFDDIVQWLKSDYWAKKHRLYNCLWCGSDRKSHYSLGLCQSCYYKYAGKLRRIGLPVAIPRLIDMLHTRGIPVDTILSDLTRGRAPSMMVLSFLLHSIQEKEKI